jgi:KTSC domain
MERKNVESTMIRSLGYDSEKKVLEVEFQSGGVYHYTGVSAEKYKALLEAPSIGQYFARNIKNDHQFHKL